MNDNQPHSSPNPTLRPKPIPYTSFCQNIPRICGVVFDFPAEICHGYPHKLKIFHCNVSPDFFCDVTLCNYIFLCIFRECLSLIVLNPDSNLFLCWIKQGQTSSSPTYFCTTPSNSRFTNSTFTRSLPKRPRSFFSVWRWIIWRTKSSL